jgi:hypothetical protein
MPRPKPDILVLLHERDRYAESENYLLWPIVERWRQLGLNVALARGPRQAVPAHLLFPHVDLTLTPPDMAALYSRYTRVVNRGVLDISKRRLSRLLVAPGDGWQGPVIVKTDLNTGGAPERRLALPLGLRRLRQLARRSAPAWLLAWRRGRPQAAPADLASARHLSPNHYPIFPSAAALPPGAIENPALVVERFMPEREGDLFAVRSWVFLGAFGHNFRRLSRAPVVRGAGVLRRDEVPVPGMLAHLRAELGFEYGRFDYVVREGEAILLDANRTPSLAGNSPSQAQRERAHRLAQGITAWLDGVPAGTPEG